MPKYLLYVIFVANAVLAQLTLKHALVKLGGRDAFNSFQSFIANAVSSPWIYAAVAIQAVGYFIWMLIISREKLGVASATAGAGFYIFMPLTAWLVYGESLTFWQWAGIGLITIGVTFVSMQGTV